MGESGSGKSTLGRLLLRLIGADAGRLAFAGKAVPPDPGSAFRREAQIVFHHPGGGAPAPYVFKVTGSEVLTSSAGGKVDCWVVTTDYNRPEMKPTVFWLAKDSQVVVKNVAVAPDGSTWVKTLIW